MSFLVLTEHAIERFVERHAPHLSYVAAKTYLEVAWVSAVRLKEKTINGQMQYRVAGREDLPSVILVVKHDNNEYVVVTVLPVKGEPSPKQQGRMQAHFNDLQQSLAEKEERKAVAHLPAKERAQMAFKIALSFLARQTGDDAEMTRAQINNLGNHFLKKDFWKD